MEGKILVTGGAGYIGSLTVRQLIKAGFDVLVIDNLSTGHIDAVDKGAQLIIGDIKNKGLLDAVFSDNKILGVMHFAGKIIVPESISHPLSYYDANVTTTLSLLRAMKAHNVNNIVFSSTAAVYGSKKENRLSENLPLTPESPYGYSKMMAEQVIYDAEKAYGIKHVIFRYFAVSGASEDGLLGEAHPKETHLIPLTVDAALENKDITIYGKDYKTKDGTNLRDYVHVLDVAEAHVLGMKHLLNEGNSDTFNLGSQDGYTNLEVIKMIAKITGKDITYHFGPRREGDPDSLVAYNAHVKDVLGWTPTHSLEDMIQSHLEWKNSHPNGYAETDYQFTEENEAHLLRYEDNDDVSPFYEDNEQAEHDRYLAYKKANHI